MLRSLFRPLHRLFRRIWRPFRSIAARRGHDVDETVQLAAVWQRMQRSLRWSTPTLPPEVEARYRREFDRRSDLFSGTPEEAAEKLCALPRSEPSPLELDFVPAGELVPETLGELLDRFGRDTILVYRDPATGQYFDDVGVAELPGLTPPITLGLLADCCQAETTISLRTRAAGKFADRHFSVVARQVGPRDPQTGLRSDHPIGRTALEIV